MATTETRRTKKMRSGWRLLVAAGLAACSMACTDAGGGLADNGGMSGTGISQGAISAFGSIFVNGVRWDLSGATIEVEGVTATEAALRVGMVVRVEGDYDAGNATGRAIRVRFDDLVEGPIETAPVETVPGVEKTFTILGRTVVVDALETVFDDGASFATLAADDVLEVTGFEDDGGAIQATRVSLRGAFPGDDDVDLVGSVSNLLTNPDDTGIFDLGSVVVRYDAATVFEDVTRAALANGDRVEVEGTLRPSGTEIDATKVELESAGLGSATDLLRVEIEGVVELCATSPDFCVAGVPVDDSAASFDPVGFVPAPGDRVEVEGPLVGGVLVAERIESEEQDALQRNVRIQGAVTSVDALAGTLLVLGVTVEADANTRIEDKSSIGDESFQFSEILPGDYLQIRGSDDGTSGVRALTIRREDAVPGADDVRLEGPVTALDTGGPSLSILGQPVPLDAGTLYFDAAGSSRTEGEFFGSPADVKVGDVVSVDDQSAADLSVLGEADEVRVEDVL